MWYWSVAILFWQLSIDYIVNGQCKRCGFVKTRLRHPSLPLDSLPYPTLQSVDAYVRAYARSVTWQPNQKRLTIFYEYGALSHARFDREGIIQQAVALQSSRISREDKSGRVSYNVFRRRHNHIKKTSRDAGDRKSLYTCSIHIIVQIVRMF